MDMDKELARKILGLTIDEQRITQQKYDLRKALNDERKDDFLYSWESVCTEAMKFLMTTDEAEVLK